MSNFMVSGQRDYKHFLLFSLVFSVCSKDPTISMYHFYNHKKNVIYVCGGTLPIGLLIQLSIESVGSESRIISHKNLPILSTNGIAP